MSVKSEFPIFQNNPGLIFLDNGASTQKPQMVIDGVSEFVSTNYSNIHRGLYRISENAENLYHQSKEKLAQFINAQTKEIIYTYNSTYAFNLVIQALVNSKKIWIWDKVLIWMWEHHSNILARQNLSKIFWFTVEFVNIDENTDLDRDNFQKKYTDAVKVVSFSQVSNVTGTIIDVKRVKSLLRDDTFFMVDGSQSVPHFKVDVQEIGCDALIMTWHKMLAYSWLWMLYLKHQRIKELEPMILWGGTVKDVSTTDYSLQSNAEKWEAGTPNVIWAVSLLKALEWIEHYGGIDKMWEHEQMLVKRGLQFFEKMKEKFRLIGSFSCENRVGVFSFVKISWDSNFNRVGEVLAAHNICVRTGGHCAYPLHKALNIGGTTRISTYVYNDLEDLEKTFEVLEELD